MDNITFNCRYSCVPGSDSGLTIQQRLIFMVMDDHCNLQTKLVAISTRDIELELKKFKISCMTVSREIKALIKKGYIAVYDKPKSKTGKTVYQLSFYKNDTQNVTRETSNINGSEDVVLHEMLQKQKNVTRNDTQSVTRETALLQGVEGDCVTRNVTQNVTINNINNILNNNKNKEKEIIKEKEKSDRGQRDVGTINIFVEAEKCGIPINPIAVDKLTSLAKDFGAERIKEVLDMMKTKGIRNMNYLEKCLLHPITEEEPKFIPSIMYARQEKHWSKKVSPESGHRWMDVWETWYDRKTDKVIREFIRETVWD